MSQPFKVCTKCQQPAILSMPICRRCGQPFPAPKKKWPKYLAGLSIVAIISLIILQYRAWTISPLVGEWVKHSSLGHDEKIIFDADGTLHLWKITPLQTMTLLDSNDPYSPSNFTTIEIKGKWYLNGQNRQASGMLTGTLILTDDINSLDQKQSLWMMTPDKQQMRFWLDPSRPDISDDYFRAK